MTGNLFDKLLISQSLRRIIRRRLVPYLIIVTIIYLQMHELLE